MTIPPLILGPGCLVLGLLMTFVIPIQRQRFWNLATDVFTLLLFIAGVWIINYWDQWSNFGVGLIAGVIAVIIRDFRLWLARFKGQVYRTTHPRYWYGRAYGWYNRRRQRRY